MLWVTPSSRELSTDTDFGISSNCFSIHRCECTWSVSVWCLCEFFVSYVCCVGSRSTTSRGRFVLFVLFNCACPFTLHAGVWIVVHKVHFKFNPQTIVFRSMPFGMYMCISTSCMCTLLCKSPLHSLYKGGPFITRRGYTAIPPKAQTCMHAPSQYITYSTPHSAELPT